MVGMVRRVRACHCFPFDRGHHDTTIGYMAVMSQYSHLGMEKVGLADLKGL